MDLFRSYSFLQGLSFTLTTLGLGLGLFNLSQVLTFDSFGVTVSYGNTAIPLRFLFTRDRFCLSSRNLDTLISLSILLTCDGVRVCVGHLDTLLLLSFSGTNSTVTFLLRHLDLGFVDSTSGCFLTKGVDVAGLVGDVPDVDVDDLQTDFLQLGLDVLGHRALELLTVFVDLLDGELGNHSPELSVDDFFGVLFDDLMVLSEEVNCRILHDPWLFTNTNSVSRRNIHADVLERQCALKWDLDLDGR